MMMIGTLALTGVGIPFTPIGFAGFVSKDAIIEAAFASHRYRRDRMRSYAPTSPPA